MKTNQEKENKILHEYVDFPLTFRLYEDGRFTLKNRKNNGKEIEMPWYKKENSGKPWMVKKSKNFKSLIKMADKDGDYDEYK